MPRGCEAILGDSSAPSHRHEGEKERKRERESRNGGSKGVARTGGVPNLGKEFAWGALRPGGGGFQLTS